MNVKFRKAGPSGYGENRVSYLVDDAWTFKFIGSVEGCGNSWRVLSDLLRADSHEKRNQIPFYKTRSEAAAVLLNRFLQENK